MIGSKWLVNGPLMGGPRSLCNCENFGIKKVYAMKAIKLHSKTMVLKRNGCIIRGQGATTYMVNVPGHLYLNRIQARFAIVSQHMT